MIWMKYLWLIGVGLGLWLVQAAWHDPSEGPAVRLLGFVVAFICLVAFLEAYRESIVEDIRNRAKQVADEKP